MPTSREDWRKDPIKRKAAKDSLREMHVALARLSLTMDRAVEGVKVVHPSSRDESGLGAIITRANTAVYEADRRVKAALAAMPMEPTETYIGNLAAYGREI